MIAPNAGFDLGGDCQPLALSWGGSRRLWSLGDMVENFRLHGIRLILIGLGVLTGVSEKNRLFVEQNGGRDDPRVREHPNAAQAVADALHEIASITGLAEELFAGLHCAHIDNAIRGLKWWAERDVREWSELKARSISLRDAIDIELKEYLYYQYPKAKGQKLLSWKTEWRPALAGFPIETDVFSAVDCYALQHNTAAVFHCMRILEHGLSVLAANVGLAFDLQQWNTIIEQIEAKITELRRLLPRGKEKNEKMQFLAEAAKEFFYFKDGWRNYVSHNRGRYDEHQAAAVLEHTRAFMNHLASYLSE
jgi:hypothetical protein